MDDNVHDQHGQIGDLHHQEEDDMIISTKQCLSKLSVKESSQYQQDLHMRTNDSKVEAKSSDLSNHTRLVCDAPDTSPNVKHGDNDRDVVFGQLRNGCDNSFLDKKQDVKLKHLSAEEILKENVPEMSKSKLNNSSTSTYGAIGTKTTSSLSFSTANFESEEDNKHLCVKEMLNESSMSKSKTSELRGKNTAQCCLTNIRMDAVCHVPSSSTNSCAVANNNKLTLNACDSSYITVLPLHACNTLNHSHHNHFHIQNHHHNHSHNNEYNNQYESENFAYELTNALSSRLLFQKTNNFTLYCTKSALNSQNKRQSSFLKSQSLEIVQDPSLSNIYHVTGDGDEHIFFQLPETDENDQQLEQNLKGSHCSKMQRHQSQQISNAEGDDLRIYTRATKSIDIDQSLNKLEEGNENECVAIARSLSLSSSQKTGVVSLKTQSLESRPIYPNVPYSPYASPYSSPRSNRRRPPLRESRRISIEQSGSFLQLNQYKLMDQIGQGSYGLVKLAYSEEDSTHYAMKILSKRRLLRQAGLMKRGPKKSTSPLDRVYREIAVLKKLDHPNVVKLVEVLDDPVEDSLYMVFELVKQGEVLSVPTKNPLKEERAWSVFRDTLLGLEYLHYQRIIHADIKPGNLLLTECGRVKIADLGVCNEFIGDDSTMTNGSTGGTPAFRAPESLNVGQNIYCGKAADIWALGATLYTLVFGNVPFVASSVPILYDKIKNEELSFHENPKTSAELRDCIQFMLKKNPSDRITLPQLKEHVWVTGGGFHPLPSEEENCRLVQVDDEDINTVVRSIPKLDTLILIKTMLKKHSFGNPFSRGISGRAPQRGGSRLERFIRAGRSNSAPGSYNMIVDRQLSCDNILPALCEHSPMNCTNQESQ